MRLEQSTATLREQAPSLQKSPFTSGNFLQLRKIDERYLLALLSRAVLSNLTVVTSITCAFQCLPAVKPRWHELVQGDQK